MNNRLKRRLSYIHWQLQQLIQKVTYRASTPWSRGFISYFWDSQAEMIHTRWGGSTHDYAVLSKLVSIYQPQSILDVGCGSGRLFDLYAQHRVSDIVGVDISLRALSLARQRYPAVSTIHGRLEDLSFPPDRFDLAICNRVLQHVPPHAIAHVIAKLGAICRLVYINELMDSDNLQDNFYMFRHDYPALFLVQGFHMLEHGFICEQTYQLYGRK